jgi:hypothetical protein
MVLPVCSIFIRRRRDGYTPNAESLQHPGIVTVAAATVVLPDAPALLVVSVEASAAKVCT